MSGDASLPYHQIARDCGRHRCISFAAALALIRMRKRKKAATTDRLFTLSETAHSVRIVSLDCHSAG